LRFLIKKIDKKQTTVYTRDCLRLGEVMRISAMFFVVLLFAACATMQRASDEADAEAKKFIPTKDKANIYIARGYAFVNGAVPIEVAIDGTIIGTITSGTYYLVTVEPGSYMVSVIAYGNEVSTRLSDAEGGINYFFEVAASAGLANAGRIRRMREQEGKRLVLSSSRLEGLYD